MENVLPNSYQALLESYQPPEGFYDELLDAELKPRPKWQRLLEGIEEMAVSGLDKREEHLRRIIRENGITYNVYSDSADVNRLWNMDIIPLLLENEEWQRLETALNQRVRVLNSMMQDIYGPQKLLLGGHYPPYLVFGNPKFLHPCKNLLPRNYRHIHLYAADLARSPDGHWWVLNDRLDAASGLGYTVENRYISARILPELFHQYGVHRLQPFLSLLSQSYEKLAPGNKEKPNIVFLTPGPANETYFEQSFLARMLGYPLVEGGDLTVRNNYVYLKTISGLQQVDVIIRRIDSEWCDPLELRSDSLLGIPGLLNVLRQCNVSMVNAPGCGVLETSALPAFLQGICNNLLGEDLILPSVATWWCGQPRELEYVLNNLGNLVVKPTYPGYGKRLKYGPKMDKNALGALKSEILKNPEAFCAQETVATSTTPIFQDKAFLPRHYIFRVYMAPSGGRYQLMPGGLARIASGGHSYSVSMQDGGESKDTWVLLGSDKTADDGPTLSSRMVTSIRRSSENLPSRVADNLYWLGRYVERSESLTRTLRVIVQSMQEEYGTSYYLGVLPLVSTFLNDEELSELKNKTEKEQNLHPINSIIHEQLYSLTRSGSLSSCFGHLKRTSTTVKERLSTDTSLMLQRLGTSFLYVPQDETNVLNDTTLQQLEIILGELSGFSGMANENMTRGQGWVFLDLGRRIERLLNMSNLFYSCLVEENAFEESTVLKILACADSTLTYRRRYLTIVNVQACMDMLVMDDTNPRSLVYQARIILDHVESLPHNRKSLPTQAMNQKALSLYSQISLLKLGQLLEKEASGRRSQLASFLDRITDEAMELSEEIAGRYFAVTQQNAPAEIRA